MMYKAFAALTLVGAPIVVLVVQSLAPQHPTAAAPAAPPPGFGPAQPFAPVAQPAPMVAPAPAPMSNVPPPDPASFGQPMPDATKPFLSPGDGLPGSPPAPPAPVDGEGAEGAAPPAG